jgi:murein L,D-transpeptidase YafK
MKQRTILSIVVITTVTVATLSGSILWKYWPSSANLSMVREHVTPKLQDQLVRRSGMPGDPIFIRIFKESSELELWTKRGDGFALFKAYPICNYSGQLGPKLKEGDRQSPEGFYSVTADQLNPNSSYHLAFNIGFPNAYDRAHKRTGSFLMVHGRCVSIGCYAMTDAGIEEIYLLAETALQNGQGSFSVHIFPFRMTEENMEEHAGSEWIGFWRNLKEGYDLFETGRVPPKVMLADKRYAFALP